MENIPVGQVSSFLDLVIQGYYSDWFFDVLLTQLTLAIKNNLALLLVVAYKWQDVSKLTKSKWDDRASNWLVQKLTRKKGEVK